MAAGLYFHRNLKIQFGSACLIFARSIRGRRECQGEEIIHNFLLENNFY